MAGNLREQQGAEEHAYSLVLRPWLWLLSFRRNCLIFHEKTAPKIIEEIFGKHGFADFKNNLSRGLSGARILRPVPRVRHGFRLPADGAVRHQLLLQAFGRRAQADPGRRDVDVQDHRRRQPPLSPGTPDRASRQGDFHTWIPKRRFTSGKVKLERLRFQETLGRSHADENRRPPSSRTASSRSTTIPGKYVERADGRRYAQAWLDMERANDGHFDADGDCVSCFPGALVSLTGQTDGG